MARYPVNTYQPREARRGMEIKFLASDVIGTGGVAVEASATTTYGIESPYVEGWIDSISISADVAAVSASGTVLATVYKWDAAAGAAVALSAAVSLEAAGITAVKTVIPVAMAALTDKQRTKLPADTLYVAVVSDAAIGTAPVNGRVVVALAQTR